MLKTEGMRKPQQMNEGGGRLGEDLLGCEGRPPSCARVFEDLMSSIPARPFVRGSS